MLKSIGTTELLVIAAIVLLLFGGKKIPEFFEGVSRAVKEFKSAANDTGTSKKEEAKK
jgi:sec-independent protein translocase protein TatA